MVFNRAKALTLSAPGEEAGAIGFPPPPSLSPPVKGKRDPRDGASQGPHLPHEGRSRVELLGLMTKVEPVVVAAFPFAGEFIVNALLRRENPKGNPTSLAGGKGEEPSRVKGAREGEQRGPRKAFTPLECPLRRPSLGPSSDLKGSVSPHVPRGMERAPTVGHHRFQHLFRLERPSAVTARHSSVPSRLNRRTDLPEATSNGSSRTELDCCSDGTTRPGL